MPPELFTQKTIAFIWDFDKTVTHSYMQTPLFKEYSIDEKKFWEEVNSYKDLFADKDLKVAQDTIYLEVILNYVRDSKFEGLSNSTLRELGSRIELAPGIIEFIQLTKNVIKEDSNFSRNQIEVEHYIVSTGLRQMILGSEISEHVKGIWACELLPNLSAVHSPKASEAFDRLPLDSVGYTIDNTSKTRAIFEINKGVNIHDSIDVNAQMPMESRRIPFHNMIYIADGPSDIPVFSLIQKNGGQTFGVYIEGMDKSYQALERLREEGRVHQVLPANYALTRT